MHQVTQKKQSLSNNGGVEAKSSAIPSSPNLSPHLSLPKIPMVLFVRVNLLVERPTYIVYLFPCILLPIKKKSHRHLYTRLGENLSLSPEFYGTN